MRRYVLAAVLVVLAAWAAAAAVRMVRAAHDLQAGVREIQQTGTTADVASLSAGSVVSGTVRSAAELQAAHRLLDSDWVLPLRLLPYVGRQVQSLDALSGAAGRVATAAGSAARQVQDVLRQPHSTPGQRMGVVRAMHSTIARFGGDIAHLDLGPADALLPPLARKRNAFIHDLTELRSHLASAEGATAGVENLLTGTHTYLLLGTNNAEMRAGTGTALEVGTVTSRSGVLRLASFTAASNLLPPRPGVTLSGDLRARWGFLEPNLDWRNLDLSPDFAANARLAAAMWEAQTGQAVDGVIDVDIGFLAQLLRVTGPVRVGGVMVDAADAAGILMKYQYEGLAVNDPGYDTRQERLGTLAQAVFGAAQVPHESPSGLTEALVAAASGRHVMVWSADPSVERDWVAAGVSGKLAPDGLLLGLVNRGGNKLDPYMSVHAHLSVVPTARSTNVQVTITVTNRSVSDTPSYANGGLYYPAGTYVGYVELDAPGWADPIRADGPTELVAAGPVGSSQILAGSVIVPRGQTRSVTYSFKINSAHASLTVEPSARIPATDWSTPDGKFTDSTAHGIRW